MKFWGIGDIGLGSVFPFLIVRKIMPKYKPETAKLKAKYLTKSYIQSGFNQTRMAKKEGVTSQAINQRFSHNPEVPKTIIELLDKAGATDKYLSKFFFKKLTAQKVISANIILTKSDDPTVKEQLAHSRTSDFIDVDDHIAQLRAAEDICKLKGHIKSNGEKGDTKITTVILNAPGLTSISTRTEAEKFSSGRSQVSVISGSVEER